VLGEALRLTRANLDEVRRSVLDLRAAALEGRRLEEALALLVDATRRDGGAKLQFQCVGARPLPTRIESNLYRIAQEALANAVTHAQARHITLRLTLEPQRAVLTVEDDGKGFAPKTRKSDRFGLVGLEERVRLLGGELRLESRPGGGARLEAALPLA
jgi:two-component system NarL family sensor kinase